MGARDLRPLGPLGMLGRAFLLARQRPRAVVWTSLIGAAPLFVAVLALYWLEEVERVRSLRPLVAVVLTAAWAWRAVLQGRAIRAAARAQWDAVELAPERGIAIRTLRTAAWTGAGLLPYLALLLGLARVAPAAMYFGLPLLALRGLLAPGSLARAACFGDAGFSAVWRAFLDHRGRRGTGLVLELLLFLAFTALCINLYAALAVLLLLGRSLAGIDLTAVESFTSLRNTFMLLLVSGSALTLLEPLRSALSAAMLVDAQVRRRGLDLRMRVDEVSSVGARASSTIVHTAVLVALFTAATALCSTGRVIAQENRRSERSAPSSVTLTPLGGPTGAAGEALDVPTAPPPVTEPTPLDRRTRGQTEDVLARSEFRDDADTSRSARDLVTRAIRWLEGLLEPDWLEGLKAGPSLPSLPGGPIYLIAAAVLLGAILAYLIFSYVRRLGSSDSTDDQGSLVVISNDPRERPPEAHLDDAARFAGDGRFREALRALYLATLVSLDRRRLIRFDTTRTNWQYLRDLPRGDARTDFAGFTRLFDHKWYGDEPTTRDDYLAGRGIAERLCSEQEPG